MRRRDRIDQCDHQTAVTTGFSGSHYWKQRPENRQTDVDNVKAHVLFVSCTSGGWNCGQQVDQQEG